MTDKTPQQEFASALAAFQADMPSVLKGSKAEVPTKSGGKYSYTYAALPDILDAALPLLTKQGLSFTAAPTLDEHGFVLRYSLLHEAGHREEGFYPLPDPAASSPQQIGSAVTYGRRYCFCALTGIAAEEDDDGQAASDARSERLPAAPRTRGATSRKTVDQVRAEDDPWATATPAPEVERVTDEAWIEDFRRRITAAGSASELRGLQGEANGQWALHKLSREDAGALRTEVDARMKELTGANG